jgi:putative NADPH-quinone reductase
MMMKNILLIEGHPDPDGGRFNHALADAYAQAAAAAGHRVRRVKLAELEFPLLQSKRQWEKDEVPAALKDLQGDIQWAGHLVFFFPLWLGDMPAKLKGLLEQVARPGFALGPPAAKGQLPQKLLRGRSARLVVTMGMPALVYRLYFFSHALRVLKRNILQFVGITPVASTVIGSVDALGDAGRAGWLANMAALGRQAG